MFPRMSVAVYNGLVRERAQTLMRVNRFDEPSFQLTVDYKSAQGQWWQKIDGVPLSLFDVALEVLNEAKMKVSKPGDGQ